MNSSYFVSLQKRKEKEVRKKYLYIKILKKLGNLF